MKLSHLLRVTYSSENVFIALFYIIYTNICYEELQGAQQWLASWRLLLKNEFHSSQLQAELRAEEYCCCNDVEAGA
jgi:hypothetical protein